MGSQVEGGLAAWEVLQVFPVEPVHCASIHRCPLILRMSFHEASSEFDLHTLP